MTALRADYPFIKFQPSHVLLPYSVGFLFKVVLAFCLSQNVIPSEFFLSPTSDAEKSRHTKHEKGIVLFGQNKSYKMLLKAFCLYAGMSSFDSDYFSLDSISYLTGILEKAGLQSPLEIQAYLTRAQSMSATFWKGTPLRDLCHGAVWSSLNMFVQHYSVDVHVTKESAVERAILHSLAH